MSNLLQFLIKDDFLIHLMDFFQTDFPPRSYLEDQDDISAVYGNLGTVTRISNNVTLYNGLEMLSTERESGYTSSTESVKITYFFSIVFYFSLFNWEKLKKTSHFFEWKI